MDRCHYYNLLLLKGYVGLTSEAELYVLDGSSAPDRLGQVQTLIAQFYPNLTVKYAKRYIISISLTSWQERGDVHISKENLHQDNLQRELFNSVDRI